MIPEPDPPVPPALITVIFTTEGRTCAATASGLPFAAAAPVDRPVESVEAELGAPVFVLPSDVVVVVSLWPASYNAAAPTPPAPPTRRAAVRRPAAPARLLRLGGGGLAGVSHAVARNPVCSGRYCWFDWSGGGSCSVMTTACPGMLSHH